MNELFRRILFLPVQASTVARAIDTLHYVVISVTMVGATVVTVIGGYFLIRYRRRAPTVPGPPVDALSHPSLGKELAAVLCLAVLFLLFWAVGVRQYIRLRVSPEGSMDVYVTAKQWMWKFAYPQGNRAIATLFVPTRRPVRLIMTSRDVIHSFFVPAFRIKQDVIPGRYTTVWFEAKAPGRYPIFCTEYCGASHSTMRGEVIALEPVDFERWLAGSEELPRPGPPVYTPPAVPGEASPAEPLSLARQGEGVAAEKGCLRCHTLDGTPHIGPTWAGLYGSTVPLADGGKIVADEAYITESIMDPAARIHEGYASVMPSYIGRLRAPEVAAIVELIRALRDVPPAPAAGPEYVPAPGKEPIP